MARRLWMAVGLLALASCGGGEESQPKEAAAARGQRLVVSQSVIPETKAVAGEVATREQAEALARIPGILTEMRVREGDVVARGQRIGMVVDSRIGFETSAYGAQAAAAAAEAARARAELRRTEYLYRNGVYAKARLESVQAASRAADAQVAAARAQQSASASVAGQGAILAPASGRVLRADVPAGSVVAPGVSVATITAGPPVLRLELPQSLARRVRPGARVQIGDEEGLGGGTGRIVQVYPSVSGGRVTADAEVPGLTTELVGRRVSVLVEAGSRSAIVVPKRFVATRYGIDYVDLVGRGGGVATIPVQTAPVADPDRIEILSGVSAGDVLLAPGPAR
ncbi:MAG TPA: efflux RND transporter periplasmic adaptor subunit [Allosphingosinicella sp.]|nr:efflux RND transporter periplasmic adaptor subunit [Allosphingosinicella sp.]